MNHVNLIGKMSSHPKIIELTNGRKIIRFTIATEETYLDEQGNNKTRFNWHRVTAWGNWVQVINSLLTIGMEVAIEGKLVSRFYKIGGTPKYIHEVEVNDLVIL
jgi:single-strand DNA-binding protein